MDWDQWLRLFVLIAMVAGAWRAWKAMPKPLWFKGHRYYPLPDGGFRTAWGRPVRDTEVLAALGRMAGEEPPGQPAEGQ